MLPSRLTTSLTLIACAALWLPGPASSAAAARPPAKPAAVAAQVKGPKLVVVMVIDGLPFEQVQRYRDQFGPGGLRRLLPARTRVFVEFVVERFRAQGLAAHFAG